MSVATVVRQVTAVNQQRLELGISGATCRNLFGPIDHDQLRAELESELRRIADEKKRRWNFDFVKLEPLDGDFLWQRIGENRTVGFTTNDESSTPETRDSNSTRAQTHAEAVSTNRTRNATSNATSSCFKTPEQMIAKRRRKSPRITDYLRAKKKASTSRQIKFTDQTGVLKLCKRVQTRKAGNSRGPTSKQSTLERYMPKLRPRHANGKVSS